MWILMPSSAAALASDAVLLSSGMAGVRAIQPSDVDEDGDLDLILGGRDDFGYLENDPLARDCPIRTFPGLTERQLFRHVPGVPIGPPLGYERLDADGDGRVDILVIADGDQLALLLAADDFSSTHALLTPLDGRAYDYEANDAAGTDLDGDGDTDIVVAR